MAIYWWLEGSNFWELNCRSLRDICCLQLCMGSGRRSAPSLALSDQRLSLPAAAALASAPQPPGAFCGSLISNSRLIMSLPPSVCVCLSPFLSVCPWHFTCLSFSLLVLAVGLGCWSLWFCYNWAWWCLPLVFTVIAYFCCTSSSSESVDVLITEGRSTFSHT